MKLYNICHTTIALTTKGPVRALIFESHKTDTVLTRFNFTYLKSLKVERNEVMFFFTLFFRNMHRQIFCDIT